VLRALQTGQAQLIVATKPSHSQENGLRPLPWCHRIATLLEFHGRHAVLALEVLASARM